uniref:Secreted protein n=1 Tax=Glossina austeni TaxID=7395 RepID=A0A1A9UYY0_GLOAU
MSVDTRLNSVLLLMICVGVIGGDGELGRLLESTEANRTVSIFLRCSVSYVMEDVMVAVVPVGVKLLSCPLIMLCRGLGRLLGKGGLADDLSLVLEALRSFTVGVDGDI